MINPRLSIVVPFHNVERYIGPCLDSLARQTFADFEAILVDDGSKDASADVARDFCARDGRFRLIGQEAQGPGPARNAGVRHAQGDYLAFVDSDDLVTRHAYEIMVRSLDETSSSFAAGNARRFNNTAGVRQSYAHRVPFAENRPATHVFDHPGLAVDRMVWNKVYRRTFWDEFAFEFPAMWYEDWPVTLRAHLDAITVDCLAAPVYYWRERESGESITQLKFRYGNLADRVRSAGMVLDLVDARAPELRETVHRHLAETDLATLAQAFATADDDETPGLVELGRRLSSRLDPRLMSGIATPQRLGYEALQAGDAELLRRLARCRADGYPPPPPARRRWRRTAAHPRAEIALRATVTGHEWTADALVLRGTAEIAHLSADPATLRLTLVCGRRRHRLPVRLPGGGTSFETAISRTLLASLPGEARISARMRRRRDALGLGSLSYLLGRRVGERWAQPVRATDGTFTLRLRGAVPELTGAGVDFGGDHLVLHCRIPSRPDSPQLRLSRTAGDLVVPLHRTGAEDCFVARIPLDDVIDAVNPDDPFLDRSTLVPRLDDGSLLLITGLRHGVLTTHRNRLVGVSRSPGMYLNLIEGPARVTADHAELSDYGRRLTISGPCWPGVDHDGITWRRFLPHSDDAVDTPTRIKIEDQRWYAETAVTGLREDDWTLFAGTHAVQADSFLLAHLPLGALHSRSGTLHVAHGSNG